MLPLPLSRLGVMHGGEGNRSNVSPCSIGTSGRVLLPLFLPRPVGGTEASFLSLNGDISPWSEERRSPLKRLGTRFGQDSVDEEG